LITLSVAVLIMLPRTLWLSPSQVDAFIETGATTVVGYLLTWTIEHQTREEALRQQTVLQLKAINQLAAIGAGSLDTEQILNDALDPVLEVMGLEIGLIHLFDEETEELTLAAHRGVSQESATALERLGLGEGPWRQAIQSDELLVIPDSSLDLEPVLLVEHRGGQLAQLLSPLKSDNQVWGILTVAAPPPHQFLQSDLELITAISSQIGVAIENAQLHQDVARQLRIQRQLNEVVERITSELELDKILPRVLQTAEELIGADVGGIALFDRERETIHYPYLHNLPQELADVTILKAEGIAGEVMTTGRPIVIDNYQTYPGAIPAFSETGLVSIVAVPIVSGNRLFGALTLASLETKRFSDEDVTILAGIGRQTGIAIENARLYENLRFYIQRITEAQENERMRIARDLHDETTQTLIAIARHLEALPTVYEQMSEAARPHLQSLQEMIDDALKGMRRFVQDLRPPTLDHLGLMATLEGLVSDLRDRNIETELQISGKARRLTPEEELVLFRIVQEALTNTWRHSGGSKVLVQVKFDPARVRISIKDNGRGFSAPERIGDLASSGRLGLIGMYERVRTLDGALTIRSEPGEGTTVIVDVPVQPESKEGSGGV
jgi:signal transduction histidine kinase